MFYKKKGKPRMGEIVLCTVQKISYHSVFVRLDEYLGHIDGMIHISEIAPGRIRNLRDYVKEGKRIVCKVLNINKRTGNIDLSLRRVGTNAMVKKLNDYKQEEKAEKLLESVGKGLKKDLKSMYEVVGFRAVEEHESLHNFFQDVVSMGKGVIDRLKVSKDVSDLLYKTITAKIKPVEYSVSGTLKLRSFESEGVEHIKKILNKIIKNKVRVKYLGAPKYGLETTALDYKTADNMMKKAVDSALEEIKKFNGEGEFAKHARNP